MTREVRWERMFPDELDAALEACPVAYVPYGLCEPHGPQNALGTDGLRAHGAACRAARLGGGVVAPVTYWNVHEVGLYATWGHPIIGQQRTWLTALPPWMFFRNACYHIRAVDALGFKAAVFYTGHAGPHGHDLATVVEVMQPHVATRLAFITDYEVTPGEYAGRFGHAGAVETEFLWALEPDCVDLSRLPAEGAPGPHFAMGADAAQASRREGEALVGGVARLLVGMARELLAQYDEDEPTRRPLSFEQVERIWERELAPRVKDMASMQELQEGGNPAPPPDSQWHLNWHIPDRA